MIDLLLYWLFGIGSAYTVAIAPVVLGALIASGVSAASSAGQTAYQSVQNNRLSRGQKQQNAFNAQQAELQRQWEEHMHDRELEESNTAFQRQTKDMLAAGVNPALLYGSGAGSGAPAASIGSGSAASGSYTPSGLNIPNIGSMLMDIQKQRAEIQNIEADTNLKNTEAAGQGIDNIYKADYWQSYLNSLNAGADKMRSESQLALQKLKTEEYETAIKAKGLEMADIDLAIKANELVMSNIDRDAHQRLVDLTIRAAELANDKASAEIDEINAEIYLINQQALTAAAQRGLIDANTKQALLEYGIDLETREAKISDIKGQARQSEVAGKWAVANQFINAGSKIVGAVASGVGAVGVANAASRAFVGVTKRFLR